MEVNIQKYQAFITAVETGSFTETAQRLNYSQSGISHMIADLESGWNVTLLERGHAGIKLTSDGTKILPAVKKLCLEFENLQRSVQELQGLKTGLIRIGTFSSVATHWLPKIIKQFQKDYPGINYEILMGDYAEIEQWIEEGRVDCGFLPLPVSKDLEAISLYKDELMAVIPKNHPFAKSESFPVEELCKSPFMLLEKGEKSGVAAVFEKNHLTPDVRFTTWDDYAIMSMVENGLGISIVPELILRRAPYDIVTLPLSVRAYRDIGFVLRNRESAGLAVLTFMKYLDYRNM